MWRHPRGYADRIQYESPGPTIHDPYKQKNLIITKPIKAIINDRESPILRIKEYCLEYQGEPKGYQHWVPAHEVESKIPKTVQQYEQKKQCLRLAVEKRPDYLVTSSPRGRTRISREKLRTPVNETVDQQPLHVPIIKKTTPQIKITTNSKEEKAETKAKAEQSKRVSAAFDEEKNQTDKIEESKVIPTPTPVAYVTDSCACIKATSRL